MITVISTTMNSMNGCNCVQCETNYKKCTSKPQGTL